MKVLLFREGLNSQAASQWQLTSVFKKCCAPRLKPGGSCVAAGVFSGHLLLKFVELVSLSLMNPYVNGISMKFVGKTTKYARVRPLGGIRGSCTATLSPFDITEF